jgi:hypothetical protein
MPFDRAGGSRSMPYQAMDQDPDAPLTPQEFASLREVALELLQREIPEDHREKFVRLGLVTYTFDGLRMTQAGQMRLARGNDTNAASGEAQRGPRTPRFFGRWW